MLLVSFPLRNLDAFDCREFVNGKKIVCLSKAMLKKLKHGVRNVVDVTERICIHSTGDIKC